VTVCKSGVGATSQLCFAEEMEARGKNKAARPVLDASRHSLITGIPSSRQERSAGER
jgi:hypothetical protein